MEHNRLIEKILRPFQLTGKKRIATEALSTIVEPFKNPINKGQIGKLCNCDFILWVEEK